MSHDHTPLQIILESKVDAEAELRCYRCDQPIDPGRWIRLAAQPGPGVADTYNTSSRTCCPDCVAAIGLLEVAVDRRSR